MTGAQYLAEIIQSRVDRVYCYPGGTIAPLIDELQIPIITTRHEQGAGYAAMGAAMVTGKPQVVMVTSGPGVTNVVTPIASAYYNDVPMIVIAGQCSETRGNRMIKQYGFQECQTIKIVETITKAAWEIESNMLRLVEYAFALAVKPRRGPVLLSVPMRVQMGEEK